MNLRGWFARFAEDPETVAWADALAKQLDGELFPGDALTQLAGMRLVDEGLITWGGVLFGFREDLEESDDPMTPMEWLERELRDPHPSDGDAKELLWRALKAAWETMPSVARENELATLTFVRRRLAARHA